MKLEYAVMSSNNDSAYLDFWPYVAKAWRELIGLEPVLLYIDKAPPPDGLSVHGRVIHIEPIDVWSIAQQAQCIRFWAAKLLDAPFIISDVDMLPINKNYYHNGAGQLGYYGIVSYSSDIINIGWYRHNPQYPMCYLAGDPHSFVKVLDLNGADIARLDPIPHKGFLKRLSRACLKSGTDQSFFHNKSNIAGNFVKHLSRGWISVKQARDRLMPDMLESPDYNAHEYIDCHLPRPLTAHAEVYDRLFKKLHLL